LKQVEAQKGASSAPERASCNRLQPKRRGTRPGGGKEDRMSLETLTAELDGMAGAVRQAAMDANETELLRLNARRQVLPVLIAREVQALAQTVAARATATEAQASVRATAAQECLDMAEEALRPLVERYDRARAARDEAARAAAVVRAVCVGTENACKDAARLVEAAVDDHRRCAEMTEAVLDRLTSYQGDLERAAAV
jgi:hypothetical protein